MALSIENQVNPKQRGPLRAIAKTARPRQWIKNVLVFSAPGAAGSLSMHHEAMLAIETFFIFCLTASGVYFINDSIDAQADRLHPDKRFRPIASGQLNRSIAVAIGMIALCSGVGLSWLIAGWQLGMVLGLYVVINLSYCLWLKNEPVIDLIAVASGFVLRAIAGGVATKVPLSDWFLIVTSFGSLFVVAGKRHAEHLDLGDERGEHRSTLAQYSLAYLRYVRAVSSGVTLTAYCFWAFQKAATAGQSSILFRLSIVPIGFGVLRYALLLDSGKGGAPEEIVLSDRRLQIAGLLWIALFALGVYGPWPH
ncbi:MAG TPA: decaprenyl-phosphate phosphoribosyltransferase [Acidimicrobiales bacterium]|nr:decaprenyl-phosphate phosphoribosyltransferase [Acidimicrobiales bacterium]